MSRGTGEREEAGLRLFPSSRGTAAASYRPGEESRAAGGRRRSGTDRPLEMGEGHAPGPSRPVD